MKIQGTNISMIRGDSEAIIVTVKDTTNAIVPLVDGDTIYFTVKESTSSEENSIQKVITVFEEGAALITIEPVDTKQLKPRTYVYDIQLNRANGTVKTIITPSAFEILREVTYD